MQPLFIHDMSKHLIKSAIAFHQVEPETINNVLNAPFTLNEDFEVSKLTPLPPIKRKKKERKSTITSQKILP